MRGINSIFVKYFKFNIYLMFRSRAYVYKYLTHSPLYRGLIIFKVLAKVCYEKLNKPCNSPRYATHSRVHSSPSFATSFQAD